MNAAADTLRRAEQLLTERATRATPAPWTAEPVGSEGHHVFGPVEAMLRPNRRPRVAACTWLDFADTHNDSDHIASWDPDVALKVAALLRREADRVETDDAYVRETYPELAWDALSYTPDPLLLALARAYLRETEEP